MGRAVVAALIAPRPTLLFSLYAAASLRELIFARTPAPAPAPGASERRGQAADTPREMNAAASADESDAGARRGRPCSRSWIVRNARERRTSTPRWSFGGLRTRRTSGPSIRCAWRPTWRACATSARGATSVKHHPKKQTSARSLARRLKNPSLLYPSPLTNSLSSPAQSLNSQTAP